MESIEDRSRRVSTRSLHQEGGTLFEHYDCFRNNVAGRHSRRVMDITRLIDRTAPCPVRTTSHSRSLQHRLEVSVRSVAYVSQAVGQWNDDDFEGLLETSRRRNTDDAISGLLIFCRGYFLQVVEGADEQVSGLIERIRADQRHSDIEMIYESDIDDRVFPQWSMGFEKVDSETLVQKVLAPAVDRGLIAPEVVREALIERFLTNQSA